MLTLYLAIVEAQENMDTSGLNRPLFYRLNQDFIAKGVKFRLDLEKF